MKCSFCGKEIPKGTGTMLVRRTGRISYYCSKRCQRYEFMKRKVSKKEFAPNGAYAGAKAA